MDIIREDFFHFLWENLHFSRESLKTTGDHAVQIIHPGYANEGDGPDYRFAKVRLNGILFIGDVELHKSASEWYHHEHHEDRRYNRVVLHVVVQDDLHRTDVSASDGQKIPTLELQTALPPSLNRLWRVYHRPVDLPCSGLIADIPIPVFKQMTKQWDRRFFRYRLDYMIGLYPHNKPITEAWQLMLVRGVFEGLGYHKNQENMLRLADFCHQNLKTSGFRRKNRKNGTKTIQETTGMLLAAAGLQTLPAGKAPDRNPLLRREDWDFSASRPANQPVTRIRQSAELYLHLLQSGPRNWLRGSIDRLWEELCCFSVAPPLGKNRHTVIFHNVILPAVHLLASWLHHKKLENEIRAHWTTQHIPLPAKTKKILQNSGVPDGDHYNRLAILHHFKYFCRFKRCTECEVMKVLAQT